MTQVSPDMVERAARAIATENGDDFDKIHRDKPHWVETRGDLGGPWRDVNALRQVDYLEMAEVALTAALGDTHVIVPKEAMSFAHQMANLCSNLKQNPIFTERYRKNMDECQSGFDAALSPAPTPEQQQ